MQKKTPSILERYELKFIIPLHYIEPISNFVSIYCSLDKYSLMSDDNFYIVNSLYLDTPYYLFLRNRLIGRESRFNMRIRSYGDVPRQPYFLEIKQKRGNIIHKYRARLYDNDWDALFLASHYEPRGDLSVKEMANIQRFRHVWHIYNAAPKVLTTYCRKAYVSNIEEYARVTFDIRLKYQEEETYNLVPSGKKLVSYDFSDASNCVVLEMKCYTSQVPLWMIDCIRAFNLKRISFSKYATGVLEALNLYKYDTTSRVPVSCF